MYLKAFDKMLQVRQEKGLETEYWNNAQDVFDWWVDPKNYTGKTTNMYKKTEKKAHLYNQNDGITKKMQMQKTLNKEIKIDTNKAEDIPKGRGKDDKQTT